MKPKVIKCPFHKEKTGSFCILDNHYHCFGCGKDGEISDLDKEIQKKIKENE
jgi:DNA primase